MNYNNSRIKICPETFRKSQESSSPKRVKSTKSRKIYKTKNLKLKVQLIKDLQNQNKSLKQKIHNLSIYLKTAKNKIISLESQQTISNATKRNLLIHQVMEKKRIKKKKLKTDTSSDVLDEENQNFNQLKKENDFLKLFNRSQMIQFQQLYTQIVNLQKKEDDQEKRIKAYNEHDRYVKRMNNKNRKIKNIW